MEDLKSVKKSRNLSGRERVHTLGSSDPLTHYVLNAIASIMTHSISLMLTLVIRHVRGIIKKLTNVEREKSQASDDQ